MLKKYLLVPLLLTTLFSTGCSVQRALNKPAPKELDFLARGASRDAVRSELGDFTVSADSALCDVHVYVEGSGGGKYARAFLYSILDLGSAGIFEIFLNPIEAAIGNDKVRTKACYNDRNLLLRASEFAKGGRERSLKLAPADTPAIESELEARPAAVVSTPAALLPLPVVVAAAPAEPLSAQMVTTDALPVAKSAPAAPVSGEGDGPAAMAAPPAPAEPLPEQMVAADALQVAPAATAPDGGDSSAAVEPAEAPAPTSPAESSAMPVPVTMMSLRGADAAT